MNKSRIKNAHLQEDSTSQYHLYRVKEVYALNVTDYIYNLSFKCITTSNIEIILAYHGVKITVQC